MGLQGATRGYYELQEVTMSDRGLKGFQGDTEGYKRLHDVTNARYLVPRPYNSNLQFR